MPGARSGRPVKLGLSGQMPVSTTPTTTPAPARAVPPCAAQAPRGPSSPSRSREELPTRLESGAAFVASTRCLALRSTRSTPGVRRRPTTWSADSDAAKPLSAVV